MKLSGKIALVTGAASGIGLAAAIALAEEGATLALVDISDDGLAAAAAKIGGGAKSFRADLADHHAIPDLVKSVIAALDRIDILINSAGVTAAPHSAIDFSDDAFEFVIGVNLRAPFMLTREIGNHMISRGGGGRIVNLSSSAGFTAEGAPAIYAASKAGINALTRTSAADLGLHGVNVNAVAPGLTRTPMIAGTEPYQEQMVSAGPMANLLHRVAEPEDVASLIVYLCLPESRQITGQVIHTSAGTVV